VEVALWWYILWKSHNDREHCEHSCAWHVGKTKRGSHIAGRMDKNYVLPYYEYVIAFLIRKETDPCMFQNTEHSMCEFNVP
jgi:hypothetical protein